MRNNSASNNNRKRSAKYYVILCVAIILVTAMAAATVYAAYLAYAHSDKRTISTWKDTSSIFNSNYMGSVDSTSDESAYPVVVVSRGDGSISLSVLVCNYNRMDDSIYSTDNITYSFKITICDASKNPYTSPINYSNFKVKYNNTDYVLDSNTKTITSQTLTGGEPSYHVYTVTFPSSFEEYIMVEAIPQDATKTDNKKLGCYITSSILDRTMAKDWTGRLTGLDDITDPTLVDGFNYEISGSGTSSYKLSWDTTHVKISDWFIEDYGLEDSIGTSGDWEYVTLSMPLGLTTDDKLFHTYNFQFFRTSKADSSEDMTEWNSWIKFELSTTG